MSAFKNLKTRNKLLATFALLALVFTVALLLAYRNLQEMQQSQQRLVDEQFGLLLHLKDMRVDTNALRATLVTSALEQRMPETQRAGLRERLKDQTESVDFLVRQSAGDSRVAGLAETYKQVWAEFAAAATDEILPLLATGQYRQAREVILGPQSDRVERLRELGDQIVAVENAHIEQLMTQNKQRVESQRNGMVVVFCVVLVLMVLLAWVMARLIAGPLENLTRWAHQIADGEVSSQRPSEARRDEVGLLSEAFFDMSRYLSDLARNAERIAEGDLREDPEPKSERDALGNAFYRMVTNLRATLQDIQEGSMVLGAASQEILASTSQVVSSAQETATSISEITTTVEEVKQTASVASDKARHVNESAERTKQVSKEGQAAIASSMDGMRQIREQMHAVAGSIVKLSEQSQAIGEVVATVNDLAEQSNLLGVNASIEAMRSGEYGKGFSAVAQEVKSLSVQSKQATAQVRAILNDIQNALNKAVMLAEQSSKAVDNGYQQAEASAQAILTLKESIEESSGAAVHIAASSQQQLVGMDQVATAMENIKQASQENVEGTQQAEQAARNLHDLGKRLKGRVSQFQLGTASELDPLSEGRMMTSPPVGDLSKKV
ncbi:methyl-accepting chemotaxis protein [Marinobacter halodurans]|uniref:Methyl-accepting chemotaxis protein n=1 Tax=Marinobacter halodurans TaxID=2528979 RepID=A0ABY1ZN27_9GAMM|nr:methyl-accepting chemotaxis protein [Marinobacter halodurans]TBW57651.1 methyl-accepting chemotaxis protein [Marinobacter halodurans]